MDSRGAPEGIRRGHSSDKGSDLGADGRAAPGGPAGELGPVQRKRRRCQRRTVSGATMTRAALHPVHTLDKPDPEEPIAAAQLRPLRRSLVHGELLAQGEVLESELAVAAAEEREESKQVEQRGDHGAGLSPDQSRKINRLSTGRVLAKDRHELSASGATAIRDGHARPPAKPRHATTGGW